MYSLSLYIVFFFIIYTLVESRLLSWDEAYLKADVLVSKMTLDQKVSIATGIGFMKGSCSGNTHAITNPDFPSLCLQDGPLGVRSANNITSGVAGINAAASFDRKAIRARADYIGKEFRGKGVHVQLGPATNMMRNPKSGRAWEGYGEDPYLAGVVSSESVLGVQNNGVIATIKHFILNEQELNRFNSSSNIDTRTLHEIYLWPFARAVEAGVGSVMCAYNKVNGIYACENDYILNTVLKGELGFRGFVQSDWTATHSTSKSANSGLDMDMPGDISIMDGPSGDSYFGKNLTDAVKSKEVSETRITDMAMRIVSSWFKMRQDENFPANMINSYAQAESPFVNVQENHKILVREMGAASNVLLKNTNHTLPINIDSGKKTIAIIGSDAGPSPDGLNTCFLNYCSNGTLAQGWGSGTADFPYMIDPLRGLSNAFGPNVKIQSTLKNWDLKEAEETAKGADYAFVFSNSDSGEGGIFDMAGDRKNLSLWENGDNLIKAVADVNANTIVVIHSVGPVLMPWIDHPNIKAVLWPGLPGQESGNSLADIVTGKINPSGRLPYTIAKQEKDYNTIIDPNEDIQYSEKLLMGYKWFDYAGIEPLFPFGYGLSYTTFDYGNLKVNTRVYYADDAKKIVDNAIVKASISITNLGKIDGAEIVQAYLSFPKSAGSPPQQLRGFEKIFLKSGKAGVANFELRKTELSIWDSVSNSWVIPSGEFIINIGASSRDIRASVGFSF